MCGACGVVGWEGTDFTPASLSFPFLISQLPVEGDKSSEEEVGGTRSSEEEAGAKGAGQERLKG